MCVQLCCDRSDLLALHTAWVKVQYNVHSNTFTILIAKAWASSVFQESYFQMNTRHHKLPRGAVPKFCSTYVTCSNTTLSTS